MRINKNEIFIGREKINLQKYYSLSSNEFICLGKEGFDCFKGSEFLIP